MVVLDTNIVIDHLRQPLKNSKLINLLKTHPKQRLALSIISIQELYEGKSTRSENREKSLISTLSSLELLPYNFETAKLAGEIARDNKQIIELADAAIAATAIINQSSLYTLNEKHFKNIPNLNLLSPKT